MKEVHFVLQGKGGVGKSYISSLLMQYLMSKKVSTLGFDTDPVNTTFSKIIGLPVQTVSILDENKKINSSAFDAFIEYLIEGKEEVAVIDNGAATFVPLLQYLTEVDVISILKSVGVKVVVHIPVVGGQAMSDTLQGAEEVLSRWDNDVVIWLNAFQGDVQLEGKKFSQFNFFIDNKDRIKGVIELPNRNPDTFGADIRLMTENNLTFDDALKSPKFGLMPKHRLKMVRDDAFQQLQTILGAFEHERSTSNKEKTQN
ncbi:Protein TraL [Oligella ureolytica]